MTAFCFHPRNPNQTAQPVGTQGFASTPPRSTNQIADPVGTTGPLSLPPRSASYIAKGLARTQALRPYGNPFETINFLLNHEYL